MKLQFLWHIFCAVFPPFFSKTFLKIYVGSLLLNGRTIKVDALVAFTIYESPNDTPAKAASLYIMTDRCLKQGNLGAFECVFVMLMHGGKYKVYICQL